MPAATLGRADGGQREHRRNRVENIAGLVFVAATNDSKFRAFDSRTGKELGSAPLDATGNATPITYQGRGGKQFVGIAAGGPAHLRNVGDTSQNRADSLIVFALSERPAVTESEPRPPGMRTRDGAVGTMKELPNAPGKEVVIDYLAKNLGK